MRCGKSDSHDLSNQGSRHPVSAPAPRERWLMAPQPGPNSHGPDTRENVEAQSTTVSDESVTRRCWRGRVYSGLGFFVVFSSVFLVPVSTTFTLSLAGGCDSGFCSRWP